MLSELFENEEKKLKELQEKVVSDLKQQIREAKEANKGGIAQSANMFEAANGRISPWNHLICLCSRKEEA